MLLRAIGSHHLLYARQGDEAIELVFQRLHTSLCSAKPLSKAALAPYDTFAIFRPNFFALSAYIVPSGTGLGSADKVGEKLNASMPIRHLFKSRITVFFGFMLAITLAPDIAPHIGEIPLRLLNIGGGVERLFYLSNKTAEDMPAEILEMPCGDKGVQCRLKPLQILLDLRPIIYVRVVREKNSAIYRIPRAGLIDVLTRTGKKPNKNIGPTS